MKLSFIQTINHIKELIALAGSEGYLLETVIPSLASSKLAWIVFKEFLQPDGYSFIFCGGNADGIELNVIGFEQFQLLSIRCFSPKPVTWEALGFESYYDVPLSNDISMKVMEIIGTSKTKGCTMPEIGNAIGVTKIHSYVDKVVNFGVVTKRTVKANGSLKMSVLHLKRFAAFYDGNLDQLSIVTDGVKRQQIFNFISSVLEHFHIQCISEYEMAKSIGVSPKTMRKFRYESERSSSFNIEKKLHYFKAPQFSVEKRKLSNSISRLKEIWYIGRFNSKDESFINNEKFSTESFYSTSDDQKQFVQLEKFTAKEYILNLSTFEKTFYYLRLSESGLTSNEIGQRLCIGNKRCAKLWMDLINVFRLPVQRYQEGKTLVSRISTDPALYISIAIDEGIKHDGYDNETNQQPDEEATKQDKLMDVELDSNHAGETGKNNKGKGDGSTFSIKTLTSDKQVLRAQLVINCLVQKDRGIASVSEIVSFIRNYETSECELKADGNSKQLPGRVEKRTIVRLLNNMKERRQIVFLLSPNLLSSEWVALVPSDLSMELDEFIENQSKLLNEDKMVVCIKSENAIDSILSASVEEVLKEESRDDPSAPVPLSCSIPSWQNYQSKVTLGIRSSLTTWMNGNLSTKCDEMVKTPFEKQLSMLDYMISYHPPNFFPFCIDLGRIFIMNMKRKTWTLAGSNGVLQKLPISHFIMFHKIFYNIPDEQQILSPDWQRDYQELLANAMQEDWSVERFQFYETKKNGAHSFLFQYISKYSNVAMVLASLFLAGVGMIQCSPSSLIVLKELISRLPNRKQNDYSNDQLSTINPAMFLFHYICIIYSSKDSPWEILSILNLGRPHSIGADIDKTTSKIQDIIHKLSQEITFFVHPLYESTLLSDESYYEAWCSTILPSLQINWNQSRPKRNNLQKKKKKKSIPLMFPYAYKSILQSNTEVILVFKDVYGKVVGEPKEMKKSQEILQNFSMLPAFPFHLLRSGYFREDDEEAEVVLENLDPIEEDCTNLMHLKSPASKLKDSVKSLTTNVRMDFQPKEEDLIHETSNTVPNPTKTPSAITEWNSQQDALLLLEFLDGILYRYPMRGLPEVLKFEHKSGSKLKSAKTFGIPLDEILLNADVLNMNFTILNAANMLKMDSVHFNGKGRKFLKVRFLYLIEHFELTTIFKIMGFVLSHLLANLEQNLPFIKRITTLWPKLLSISKQRQAPNRAKDTKLFEFIFNQLVKILCEEDKIIRQLGYQKLLNDVGSYSEFQHEIDNEQVLKESMLKTIRVLREMYMMNWLRKRNTTTTSSSSSDGPHEAAVIGDNNIGTMEGNLFEVEEIKVSHLDEFELTPHYLETVSNSDVASYFRHLIKICEINEVSSMDISDKLIIEKPLYQLLRPDSSSRTDSLRLSSHELLDVLHTIVNFNDQADQHFVGCMHSISISINNLDDNPIQNSDVVNSQTIEVERVDRVQFNKQSIKSVFVKETEKLPDSYSSDALNRMQMSFQYAGFDSRMIEKVGKKRKLNADINIVPPGNPTGEKKYMKTATQGEFSGVVDNKSSSDDLPWLFMNGEVNISMFQMFASRLLSLLIEQPGIPKQFLMSAIQPILNDKQTEIFLDILEYKCKYIYSKSIATYSTIPTNFLLSSNTMKLNNLTVNAKDTTKKYFLSPDIYL